MAGFRRKATSVPLQKFENQRKNARKQYDDYDGIWLGHIAQFIFLFFFLIGQVDNVAIIIGTKTDGFPSSPNNDICLYMAQANAAKKLSNLLTS